MSGAPRYRSTRAPAGAPGVRFGDALLAGLAPDGGLYLPDRIPPLPDGWTEARSLAELGALVLPDWIDDLPRERVEAALRDALPFDAPVAPLSDRRFALELFHGPTLSFKDVGARTMARLMDAYLEERGGRAVVLVATSGDTGSAVADGFAGMERSSVELLYPAGMVSEVQERQLIAARPNVRAYRVDGTFDDCQRLVKGAFADPALSGLPLSSANSINIGRLLPQMLYYLHGALQIGRRLGLAGPPDDLVVVVPSGNLGNLTAGMMAAEAGLPVARFVAAHNANDHVPRWLLGEADADAFPATRKTLSNAMDVGAPSNFERLRALFGEGLRARLHGVGVDDDATLAAMRAAWDRDGYVACPHTAVGLEAAERLRSARPELAAAPTMILATAHPAKFPDVVAQALPLEPPTSAAIEALATLEARVEGLEPDPAALRRALLRG